MRRRGPRCVIGAFILAVGCSAPSQGPGDDGVDIGEEPDALDATEGSGDVSDSAIPDAEAATADRPPSPDGWTRPEGSAALRFRVDDTANRTYQGGQLKWTGSFAWDAATNTITPATSWLPTDGPYPPLHDDGPWDAGGHEPPGATAGDHVFECEVWFQADEDTTFEYGALNEFDRWVWIGPNGVVTVPKGSTDTIEVPGLTLPAFGDVDLKVTLDLAALHADFSNITPYDPGTGLGYRIYLKSSANSWTPVELLDDGQRGDDDAGDGVFTYVQSLNLGPHDGLLADGSHAQFVFVFAMEGIEPDDGLEYKVENHCATEGVKAYSDHGSTGTFHDEPLVLERDSRGKVFNTTVIVGQGAPWCLVAEDCWGGVPCEDGACGSETPPQPPIISGVHPAFGTALGGTEVTISGQNFLQGAAVVFGGVQVTPASVSATEARLATPKHPTGLVDVTVRNPDGKEATAPQVFEYVAKGTPVLDGRVGMDWDETFLVAENAVPTDWGPVLNELARLYASYDDQFLYVGLRGRCEATNAIVGFADLDLGVGTGVADLGTLADTTGALDNAISSLVVVQEPGFGAEMGFGTKGMAQATGFVGAGTTPPECDLAGWRMLGNPADLGWVLSGGEVLTDTDEGGVETWIPLSVLYPDGVPAAGATMGLVVRLVNHDGTATSNQALPAEASGWTQGLSARVRVR